jgi:catechol 2,3-dioxygenase-like lactoylglutathione lyase family enzyme
MKTPIQYLCPLLQVFDMNTSLKFYCDVLGFRIHESAGPKDALDWVWLKLDDIDLMLNTAYETPFRPEHPDLARVASHDDTALYLGCPDVDAAYHELLSKGITLSPPTIAPYGMKQLYVHDPDGFNLCFQWPGTGFHK